MKQRSALFLLMLLATIVNAQEPSIYTLENGADRKRIFILPVLTTDTYSESNEITALLYKEQSTLSSHYVMPDRKRLEAALQTARLEADDYEHVVPFARGLGAPFILWSKLGKTQAGERVFILELIETGSGHIVGGAYRSLPSNVYNRYTEVVRPILPTMILEDIEKLLPEMVDEMVRMAARSAQTSELFAVRPVEVTAQDELADEADIFRHIMLVETAKAKIYLVDPDKDVRVSYVAQIEVRISREERTYTISYIHDGVVIRRVSDTAPVIGFESGDAPVIGFESSIAQMIALIQQEEAEEQPPPPPPDTPPQPIVPPPKADEGETQPVLPNPDFLFYISLRLGVYTPFDTLNNAFFGDMTVIKGEPLGDGIEFGAAFTWQFLKHVGLSVEAVYIDDILAMEQTNGSVKVESKLLQIPLLLRLDFRTNRFLFGVFGGAYVTPLALGGDGIRIEDSGFADYFGHYGMTPMGLLFGGSVGIRLGRFAIFTDLRYQMDLPGRGLSASGFKSASGSTSDVLLYTRNKLSYSLGFEIGLWDKE